MNLKCAIQAGLACDEQVVCAAVISWHLPILVPRSQRLHTSTRVWHRAHGSCRSIDSIGKRLPTGVGQRRMCRGSICTGNLALSGSGSGYDIGMNLSLQWPVSCLLQHLPQSQFPLTLGLLGQSRCTQFNAGQVLRKNPIPATQISSAARHGVMHWPFGFVPTSQARMSHPHK